MDSYRKMSMKLPTLKFSLQDKDQEYKTLAPKILTDYGVSHV